MITRPITGCFRRINLTLVLLLILCATVSGYQYRKGKDLYITGDFREDLFLVGSTVNFDGSNVGDILAAARGVVTINGSVDGNVIAGAIKVTVNGDISRSLRCAAQTVIIASRVDGDVVTFSADMTLSEDAVIGRDIAVYGAEAFIDGTVAGKAYVSGGNVTIAGRIDGDVTIIADKISITPDAVIGGELNYTSQAKATIASEAQIAGDVKWKKKSRSSESSGLWGMIPRPVGFFWSAVFFVGSLLMGVAMILIRRNQVVDIVEEIKKNAALDGLIGIGLIVVVPVLLFLIGITLVGIPVAIAGFAIYTFVFLAAKIFAGITIGLLLLGLLKKNGRISLGWALLVGMIILAISFKIPVLGWIAYFLAWAVGSGALMMRLFRKKVTTAPIP
jgi:cytoskeletal protein CcmA (bactofilin family)